jgi:predicted amidohydrolase YtcJ
MHTLLTNGTFVTMDPERPRAGRILIEDDRIVALDVELEPSADLEVVDLAGQTVLPAFADCHPHLTFTGCQVIDGSLADCRSTVELQ